MTKQEVRWAAVNLLDIQARDIVYDIGAGTGSVAIELARHTERGLVYAIERKDAGLELIAQNRKALGAFNVIAVAGIWRLKPLQDCPFRTLPLLGEAAENCRKS